MHTLSHHLSCPQKQKRCEQFWHEKYKVLSSSSSPGTSSALAIPTTQHVRQSAAAGSPWATSVLDRYASSDLTDFELNLASFLISKPYPVCFSWQRANMHRGSQKRQKWWDLSHRKSAACASEYHINSMWPFTECRKAECPFFVFSLWCPGLYCTGPGELY